MDKELIKNELESKTLSKKSYNYLFKNGIVKNLILGFILFLVLLFSILNHDKLTRFIALKTNNYELNILLYYIIIIASLILPVGVAIYNLINILKNKDWTNLCYKLFSKIDLPQFIIASLAIILFLINNVVTTCNVSGSSMEPNYYNNDKLLVWCLNADYDIDDVIIFDSSNYDYEASFYIKRVVAADKDKVRYDNLTGKLYVNDLYVEDITYEEYLNITYSIDYDYGPGIFYEFIVPDNQLLVFGDNRNVSRDSRLIGLIDKGDVLGKAFFRIFPFDDFGVVR